MNLLRAALNGHWLVALTVMAVAFGYTAGGTVDGSGGLVAVLALGFVVLLWFALFDRSMLERSGRARLTLRSDADAVDPLLLDPATTIYAVLAVLLSVVTLAVSFWIGVGLLVSLLAVWLLWIGRARRGRSRSFVGLEFEFALGAVVLPYLLMSGVSAAEPAGAGAVTLTVALGLAVLLLLPAVRDRASDEAALNVTTATALGRVGASWVAIAALALMIVFASAASGGGVWTWGVPVIVAVASLIVVWCLATRSEENAVPVWAGVCVFVALTAALSLERTDVVLDEGASVGSADGADDGETGDVGGARDEGAAS